MPPPTPRVRVSPADVLAYFITFRTYGTWLHGDLRGSIDRRHNVPGTPLIEPSSAVRGRALRAVRGDGVILTPRQQEICTAAIQGLCDKRGWKLRALNVRSNHVHTVVTAPMLGERVMGDMKPFATRALRKAGEASEDARLWSHHGSTHLLFDPNRVFAAIAYVVEQQGARHGVVGPNED